MKSKTLIPLNELCSHYRVEMSFLTGLDEIGLIEIKTVRKVRFLPEDQITELEKMIRLHHELDVNMEGIDVVFNLLQKIENLQNELKAMRRRLKRYED